MLFQKLLISSSLLTLSLATAKTTKAAKTKASKTKTSSSSASSTVLDVPVGTLSAGWAGSVIGVNGCDSTTLALRCDKASSASGNELCRTATGAEVTVTHNSNTYQLAYVTSSGGTVTTSESCVVDDVKSTAACEVRVIGGGSSTSAGNATVISNFKYAQVPITANVDVSKLRAASCTTSDNAAMATSFKEVYKVLVPLGAVVVAGVGGLV